MRVRCERYVGTAHPVLDVEIPDSPRHSVRVGREYHVLAIHARGDSAVVDFMIVDDTGDQRLASSLMFSVVSDRIPSCWRVRLREEGGVTLAPEEWLEKGFWDKYYHDDFEAGQRARETFRRMVEDMEAEDPRPPTDA